MISSRGYSLRLTDYLGYNLWEVSRRRGEPWRWWEQDSSCPSGYPDRWRPGCWCCSGRCECGRSPVNINKNNQLRIFSFWYRQMKYQWQFVIDETAMRLFFQYMFFLITLNISLNYFVLYYDSRKLETQRKYWNYEPNRYN